MNKDKLSEAIIYVITDWAREHSLDIDFNCLRDLESGLFNGIIKAFANIETVGWNQMTALDSAVISAISDWAEMNAVKDMTYRRLRIFENELVGHIKENWTAIYPGWASNIGKLKE